MQENIWDQKTLLDNVREQMWLMWPVKLVLVSSANLKLVTMSH